MAEQEIATFEESGECATSTTRTAIAALQGMIAIHHAGAKKAFKESRKTAEKARSKTMDSFLDCTKHHVLTMFPMDAAEVQNYYIRLSKHKPDQ